MSTNVQQIRVLSKAFYLQAIEQHKDQQLYLIVTVFSLKLWILSLVQLKDPVTETEAFPERYVMVNFYELLYSSKVSKSVLRVLPLFI